MTDPHASVEQAALTWLVAVNDLDFADWDGLEAWLAANPRHAEVYWRLAEDEVELRDRLAAAPVIPSPVAAPRVVAFRPRPHRRWIITGVGMAAAVAAVVWMGWPSTWTVETAPGEQRSLTLADGSQLHLDGATRLTLDRKAPRTVVLDSGRALFEVAHDDARPFAVTVGDATVTDLGTVFDITRLADGARVGVAEGSVRVEASGHAATLQAGEGLTARAGVIQRRAVDAGEVSDWRSGRLSYRAETLGIVGQDIARDIGRPIVIDPELTGRTFTGSLDTTGDEAGLRARLELLLDVSIQVEGQTWRLRRRPAE